MDSISLSILSHRSDIQRQCRILKRVYSSLDEREVEAMCWESMWRAIPTAEKKGLPVAAVYYWQVRSDLSGLMDWYSRRQRLVSFIEDEIVIEQLDNPENYLEALQTVERTKRPLRGLLEEVMEGLGIKSAYAKTRIRDARKALGLTKSAGAGRYTVEQKMAVLAYLGIHIGSPVDSTTESGESGNTPPDAPAVTEAAGAFRNHAPLNGLPSTNPQTIQLNLPPL